MTEGDIACTVGGPSTRLCCEGAFRAAPGWDPASGLGSPNFVVLRNLALNPSMLFPDGGSGVAPESKEEPAKNHMRMLWIVVALVVGVAAMLALVVVALSRKVARLARDKETGRSTGLSPAIAPTDRYQQI